MAKGFAAKIASLFGFKTISEEFYENLEDTLIEGDFGAKNAMLISDMLRNQKENDSEKLLLVVKEEISKKINSYKLNPPSDDLSVYMILGVNGVGKTTTIAKLGKYFSNLGIKTVFAAADTFRAAAIDQLEIHANKLGLRIIKQENGSDPGAVVYDAISSAISKKDNLILCDTAGRMHNKDDLLRELKKIDKIVKDRIKPENYKKILVIDSTTGQNAVSQAEIFNNAIGLDCLILTKYDSESKGGAITQIPIPVSFVGIGENYEDLRIFDRDEFLNSLLNE